MQYDEMFGKCKGKQGSYYRKLLDKFANGFVCLSTFIKNSYAILYLNDL